VSNRGLYKVHVRAWTDRTIHVHADGYDEAEEKALKEMVFLVGGYDPEVLWAIEVEQTDDWPIDRADD